MSNRILELAGLLKEAKADKAAFKLYCEDPYGGGLIQRPVFKGEMLTMADGDIAEFVGITADGKKVIVKDEDSGKQREVSPKKVDGKILAADAPVDGPEFLKGSKKAYTEGLILEGKSDKAAVVAKILSAYSNLNVIKDARKALAAAYDAGCAASKK